jgi:predicted RNase H-like HicB family nuclease
MRYELSNPIYWKVSESAPVWMGVCDVLGLTVVADTQEDLLDTISQASHECFKDLHEDGQLEETFLRNNIQFQVSYNGEVEQFEGVGVTLMCRQFPSAEEKLKQLVRNTYRIIGQEDMDLLDTRCALRALLAMVED